MSLNIQTLITDIYTLVQRKDGWFDERLSDYLASDISHRLRASLNDSRQQKPTLRLSAMGPRCPKALWHSIHTPELAEALPPWAEVKYSFGHVLEALAVVLAKAAGHEVTGEQDEVVVDGIVGHRDCVIDGCVVDIKSCSSRQFDKYKSGSVAQDDGFGYLDQLDGYLVGSLSDELVRCKDRGYILAIDKTLGHMVLYEHRLREASIRNRIKNFKAIVAQESPPQCECKTRSYGKSGNIGLDVKASYNVFKYCCFPKLRTFLYSDGPQYLTTVVRKPDVIEVDRYGHIVYN